MSSDNDKRIAAEAAVAEVMDGMLVGLGTGSTAAFAIAALGRRRVEGLDFAAFATSKAGRRLALDSEIPIGNFAFFPRLDIAIDGADEIDPALRVIKGAGGALLREKIVAASANRMIIVADASKQVARLGAAPVPVEILPFARSFATERLRALGAEVVLRNGPRGAYRSDNGNAILDCHFGALPDPKELAARIAAIPGALGHGLFLEEVDAAYIATDGIVTRLERDQPKR